MNNIILWLDEDGNTHATWQNSFDLGDEMIMAVIECAIRPMLRDFEGNEIVIEG